jgi:hypothetical protein
MGLKRVSRGWGGLGAWEKRRRRKTVTISHHSQPVQFQVFRKSQSRFSNRCYTFVITSAFPASTGVHQMSAARPLWPAALRKALFRGDFVDFNMGGIAGLENERLFGNLTAGRSRAR